MNETRRQVYLSALGIENYTPRWLLPFAPISVSCVVPVLDIPIKTFAISTVGFAAETAEKVVEGKNLEPNLLTTIEDFREQKTTFLAMSAATALQEQKIAPPVVQPFALTVYRPQPGFLVIDSRNTQLALPTELLLNNLLLAYLKSVQFTLGEEVLRWPMIENRFVSRTEDDARNELQTWLAVENELRPVHTLWLMGENAARFWLEPSDEWSEICWTNQPIKDSTIQASIWPSLNVLLQNPLQKSKLWACLP